jgi:hypothetical protein
MWKGSFESNVTNQKWDVTLALGASNQIVCSNANENGLGNQVDCWKFENPWFFAMKWFKCLLLNWFLIVL